MYINYKHRIFGLDVIRAIAILLVLFSHSTFLLFPNKESTLLNGIRFFGTIGVDLFFVLSGFLIGGIILKQLKQEKTKFKHFSYFWIRRWFRTLPNYFLVLVLNVMVFYVLHDKTISEIGSYFIFFQNFSQPHPDFFTEAWSLSIEEVAYVVGPFLLYFLLLLNTSFSKKKVYLIVTFFIIILSIIFRYNFHIGQFISSDHQWSQELRKVVIYRVDSIYYGFLGAYVAIYFKTIWEDYKRWFFYLGFGLFFGMHLLIFIYDMRPSNTTLFYNVFYLPLVSISLLLFFPMATSFKSAIFFKSQVTRISILSYAMYLINYSLIILTIQFFINLEEVSILIKITALIFYWASTFYFSHLLFTYFEWPMTQLRDLKFVKRYFE